MNVTVVHDEHGEIVSIAKIGDLAKAGSKFARVGLVPGAGQKAVDVELSEELAARPLRELHAGYKVDAASASLVRKER